MPTHQAGIARPARAYTLVEVLVVVTVLGIAAAMIVPSLSSASVLRIQGAVRTLVADIAIAQSDAIAYQKGRAIIFYNDPVNPRYAVFEVNGPTIDLAVDKLKDQTFAGSNFGDVAFDHINVPNSMLVFDELGGPVDAPASSNAAAPGSIEIVGSGQRFRLNFEAFTGKVTVETMPP